MTQGQELSTGDRIRIARDAMGLSQQVLASQVGVAKAMVGQWEIGNREPKVPALIALADALACSFTWLATGTGNPKDVDRPNPALLEACVAVALSQADLADVPARVAALYRHACGIGLGIRGETRAELVPQVRDMAGRS